MAMVSVRLKVAALEHREGRGQPPLVVRLEDGGGGAIHVPVREEGQNYWRVGSDVLLQVVASDREVG
jgi:hypothetical protein